MSFEIKVTGNSFNPIVNTNQNEGSDNEIGNLPPNKKQKVTHVANFIIVARVNDQSDQPRDIKLVLKRPQLEYNFPDGDGTFDPKAALLAYYLQENRWEENRCEEAINDYNQLNELPHKLSEAVHALFDTVFSTSEEKYLKNLEEVKADIEKNKKEYSNAEKLREAQYGTQFKELGNKISTSEKAYFKRMDDLHVLNEELTPSNRALEKANSQKNVLIEQEKQQQDPIEKLKLQMLIKANEEESSRCEMAVNKFLSDITSTKKLVESEKELRNNYSRQQNLNLQKFQNITGPLLDKITVLTHGKLQLEKNLAKVKLALWPLSKEEKIFIADFIKSHLKPYLSGEITRQNEDKTRAPITQKLSREFEKEFTYTIITSEMLKQVAFDEYVMQGVRGSLQRIYPDLQVTYEQVEPKVVQGIVAALKNALQIDFRGFKGIPEPVEAEKDFPTLTLVRNAMKRILKK